MVMERSCNGIRAGRTVSGVRRVIASPSGRVNVTSFGEWFLSLQEWLGSLTCARSAPHLKCNRITPCSWIGPSRSFAKPSRRGMARRDA